MKYQIIQHLKTKSNVLTMVDTPEQAKDYVRNLGARFDGLAYIGNFPIFRTVPTGTQTKHKTYSIQGYANCGIVCSLNTKVVEALSN